MSIGLGHMKGAVARKLNGYLPLSIEEASFLTEAVSDVRRVDPGVDIVRQGDPQTSISVILSGYASRYRVLNGCRPIISFMTPGDFCDVRTLLLDAMDYSIGAVTSCTVGQLSNRIFDAIRDRYPNLHQTVLWSGLVDDLIVRERIVALGHRDSRQQAAHLICELAFRAEAAGASAADNFKLPFRQQTISSALGITPVHTNRILRRFQVDGLTEGGRGSIRIRDLPGLMAAAEFDPAYLHQRHAATTPTRALRQA